MMKTLYLIDGHALVFKMYYAFLRRPMINSKGQDTSILFGFTKYILELLEREKPTHFAVAFDPPGGTFRNVMYADYKANRAETPQLVIDALEPLTEICSLLNIPVLMKPGFEADDVIGSVAKRAEKEGFSVRMVTPDKDYGQLVSDNVLQLKPGKSGADDELVGVAQLREKYGIERPEQVIEILTLCGDSADNVPGVKGIGEVGAGKLIGKYGTVENIYAHLDELSDRQKAMFEAARGYIALSHELVTIKTDVEVETSCEEMAVNMDYSPKVCELFDEYEFSSLKKFLSHVEYTKDNGKTLEYEVIAPEILCKSARKSGKCAFSVHSEGEGFFTGIKSVTVATVAGGKNYLANGQLEDFSGILSDGNISKYGYDLKYQTNLLAYNGLQLAGKLYDIELLHYLINPEKSHKLDLLAKTYLDVDINTVDADSRPEGFLLFDDIPEEDDKPPYMEILAMLFVGEKLIGELEQKADGISMRLYNEMEEPLLRVLARMEMEGVRVDIPQLRHFATELSMQLSEIQSRCRELAGEPELNIMSPKQVGEVIYEKLKLDPKVKAKTGKRYQYPTDEETLTALIDKHPIINEILEFRGVKKLLSTYIEPFPSYVNPTTGKVHTTFNQALTSTGRLSSSKPNLQNIPIRTEQGKEIRKAFVPSRPDGLILSADYSQIELRIMAHLSGDRHLIEAFRAGEDVHSMTAAKIFKEEIGQVTAEQRRIAKTANFGIMYGISSFGLSQRLGTSRSDSKKIIEDYFSNFPAINSFIESEKAFAMENGYVETMFGRRRYIPDINSRNANVRMMAERTAVNAPIQGTAADIIKLAMIKLDERIRTEGLASRMVLQIHDELLFDTLPDEVERLKAIVVEEMENVVRLSIPLTVECNYGNNWLEAH